MKVSKLAGRVGAALESKQGQQLGFSGLQESERSPGGPKPCRLSGGGCRGLSMKLRSPPSWRAA